MSEELTLPQRMSAWPQDLKAYVGELQTEMKRVTWPSWKEVRATTGVVIFAVFAFALYFALVDAVVGGAVQKMFDAFTK